MSDKNGKKAEIKPATNAIKNHMISFLEYT